jgi:hypothetical protein
MDTDLDRLLIAVYCTVDDFLPARAETPGEGSLTRRSSAVRRADDDGLSSDARFVAAARRQLGHLFPQLPRADRLPQGAGYACR